MINESDTIKSDNDRLTKRVYRNPELLVYGNIREVTENVGNTSHKNDNVPSTGNTKTA
jgi:hypothetical protein